jgi:hypothetical protein
VETVRPKIVKKKKKKEVEPILDELDNSIPGAFFILKEKIRIKKGETA